jgi:small subunit ribosomal protein S13
MPRVAGIDIPANKRVVVALTYIYGIGRSLAERICLETGVDVNVRTKSLTEDQLSRLNSFIDRNFQVEGSLRRQITQNVQRLKDISAYRGWRHRRSLPVRGQRTRTNARTRKGPRKTVAGKKQTAKPGA